MLAFLTGANVASAGLTGGRAFAGTALLLLALLVFLIGGPHSERHEVGRISCRSDHSSKTTPKRGRHIGVATVIWA